MRDLMRLFIITLVLLEGVFGYDELCKGRWSDALVGFHQQL